VNEGRSLRAPSRRTVAALALALALCARASVARAQVTDGGLGMPPPPPPDPPQTVSTPETPVASSQSPSPAVTPPGATLGALSVTAAPALPPPPPNAVSRRSSRASRQLARLDAVLQDQAEGDREARRFLGTGLLVGGGVCAVAGVIPLLLPSSGGSGSLSNIITASTMVGLGAGIALGGGVTLLSRSAWEEMADELRADVVPEPEARLSAAMSRWQLRAERERSGQRTSGVVLVATGALAAGFGVWSLVSPSLTSGFGAAVGGPFIAIGAAYIPVGIAQFVLRTPAERALRMFRASQGASLAWRGDVGGARIVGVAPSPVGLSVLGVF
jgi:hypothetical protein